jgi:hypothetical protein
MYENTILGIDALIITVRSPPTSDMAAFLTKEPESIEMIVKHQKREKGWLGI